jgi:Ca2+-binding EF-hand superfamily protein
MLLSIVRSPVSYYCVGECQVKGAEDAIRTAFIDADKAGTGQLSAADVEVPLKASGLKFTSHQIMVLRRKLDKERTGSVCIHDFLQLLGIESA